ncbi:MAG: ATP-binding protein [Cyanobacteria bacterium P01_A01_bin.114]
MEETLKLLVVDDDDVDRMALRRALQRSKLTFNLQEVDSAEAGTELLKSDSFDCAFLDYQLPGADGLTLINRLRASNVKIPLIVLTGQGSEETAVSLMKAGASDYLSKAKLSSETLSRAVQSAIRLRQAEDEIALAHQRLRDTNELLKQQNQALEAQREQIQRKNLQLVEVSRLKSEFLATMSHELRTPLNAIIGFSQILMRQSGGSDERRQDMLSRILANGKHLLELINDILDFSRIEAGRLELRPEPLNVTDLVSSTVASLRSLAEQKQIELKTDITVSDPNIVNDPNRLRQVLTNLLSNAIKFTEIGSVCVIVLELAADTLEIAVEDTGIGIAADSLPYVFDAFRQVDQSVSRKHQGTGLGLSITSLLLEMMQGQISVESELGRGSCFKVQFPRRVRPAQTPQI